MAEFWQAESTNESWTSRSWLETHFAGADCMNTETSRMQEKMVFRKTNRNKGRHISVTPLNSTNKHLSYGRIILDESTPSVSFDNQNQETGLICLSGSGTVKVGADSFRVGQ